MIRPRVLCSWFVLPILLGAAALAQEPTRKPETVLTGTWTWQWTGSEGETHRHVLVVAGEAPNYAARERIGELEPVEVTGLTVVGNRVRFQVLRGETTATYDGRFADANTINGQVQVTGSGSRVNEYGWTAKRVRPPAETPPPPPPPESPSQPPESPTGADEGSDQPR